MSLVQTVYMYLARSTMTVSQKKKKKKERKKEETEKNTVLKGATHTLTKTHNLLNTQMMKSCVQVKSNIVSFDDNWKPYVLHNV